MDNIAKKENKEDKIPMSVLKAEDQPKKNFLDIICPYCGSCGRNKIQLVVGGREIA